METKAIAQIFGRAIQRPVPRTSRSRVQARQEIGEAQVDVLNKAIAAIREKARLNPSWAKGYNSSITSLEMLLAEVTQ